MSDTKKIPVTKKIAGILRAVAGTPDPKNFTSAVICAAGSSTRMEKLMGEPRKQFIELDGLPVKLFAKAVSAEMGWGGNCYDGVNYSLHRHNYFKTFDFTHCGGPSRLENAERDVRELDPVLDDVEQKFCISMPWLKKFDKELIDRYVTVFRNVIENRDQLMQKEEGEGGLDGTQAGRWYGFVNQ